MEENSCILFPYAMVDGKELKDENGNPIKSKLWEELEKMTSRAFGETTSESRDMALDLWKLAHYKPFQESDEYGRFLKYYTIKDSKGNLSKGEVSYESFMSALFHLSSVSEYTDASGKTVLTELPESIIKVVPEIILENINSKIVSTKENPKTIETQLKEALDLIAELSINSTFGTLAPAIRYKKGSKNKQLEVYFSDDTNALYKFVSNQTLLSRLQHFLASFGITYTFMDSNTRNNVYTEDENGGDTAYKHIDACIHLTHDVSSKKVTRDLCDQTATLVTYMLQDDSLITRLMSDITEDQFVSIYMELFGSSDKSQTKEEKEALEKTAAELYRDVSFDTYQPIMAKMISDYLMKGAPKNANIFTRIWNKIKMLFTGLHNRDLRAAKIRAEKEAREIAWKVLHQDIDFNDAVAARLKEVPSIYSDKTPLGSLAAFSNPQIIAAKKIMAQLNQLISDLDTVEPKLARRLREDILEKGKVTFQSTSPIMAQMAGVDSILKMSIGLEKEYDNIVDALSKINFEVDNINPENATTIMQAIFFMDRVKNIRDIILETLSSMPVYSDSRESSSLQTKLKTASELLGKFTKQYGGSESLEEAIFTRAKQWYAKLCENFYGAPYIEITTRSVLRKGKLLHLREKRRYFDQQTAVAYTNAYRDIAKFLEGNITELKEGSLAETLYLEEVAPKGTELAQKEYIEKRLKKAEEEQSNTLLDTLEFDVSWISALMQSMMYSGDIMNQFKDIMIKQSKDQANLQTREDLAEINALAKEFEKASGLSDAATRKLFEVDENGVFTGFFVTPYNRGKWKAAYEEARKSWKEEFIKLNPKFKDLPFTDARKRDAYIAFFKKKKREWHQANSHWSKELQQWVPGAKVKKSSIGTVAKEDLFGDVVNNNINLANYDNTDSDFTAIENLDSQFRRPNGEINRESGYYEDSEGNKYVRYHRIQETDRGGKNIPSSQATEKLTKEEWIRSGEKGTRTDAFLRTVFDNKGTDFEAALKAANAEAVELKEGMSPELLKDDSYTRALYNNAVEFMKALASRGVKWKSTNLIISTTLGKMRMAGEMDLLLKFPDGHMEVWDMKTTDKLAGEKFSPSQNPNYETQLNFYARALRSKGYNATVGGIFQINPTDGKFNFVVKATLPLDRLKVAPFNQNSKSFTEALQHQYAVEHNNNTGTTVEEEDAEDVFANSTIVTARASQVIAYVKTYHPQYLNAVKAYLEYAGDNVAPYMALMKFGIHPSSKVEMINWTTAAANANNESDEYEIRGYESEQWKKLSDKERTILLKICDLKARMDARYPQYTTQYGWAPQFKQRDVAQVRARGGVSANPVAQVQVFGRKVRNTFALAAEDYEFGGDNTYNGDEDEVLFDEARVQEDVLRRVPIIGVNKFIQPRDIVKIRNLERQRAAAITDKERDALDKKIVAAKKEAQSEFSTEVFNSLACYSVMTNTYFALSKVCDGLEVGETILNKRADKSPSNLRKPNTGINKEGRSLKHAKDVSRRYLDKELYNIQTEKVWVGAVLISKLLKPFGRLASFLTIAGNPVAGQVNRNVGRRLTFAEAIVGQWYTVPEWLQAEALFMEYFAGQFWSGGVKNWMAGGKVHLALGDDVKQDKVSIFLQMVNSQRKVTEQYEKYNPQKSKFRKLNPLSEQLYAPFEIGDMYMQGMSALASGFHVKLYDTTTGKEISLFDAYQMDRSNYKRTGFNTLKIKEGVIKDKKDTEKYKQLTKDIAEIRPQLESILIEYSRIEKALTDQEKKLKIAEINEVRNKLNDLENQLAKITWQNSDLVNFSIQVGNINVGLHGVYNTIDKVAFQYYIYGQLVSAMRGYAFGNVQRVFGESKTSLSLKGVGTSLPNVEGEMVSFFKTFWYAILGANQEMDDGSFKKLDYNFAQRLLGMVSNLIPIPVVNAKVSERQMRKHGFSDSTIYGVRRLNTHVALAAISWILLRSMWVVGQFLLAKLEDDFDEFKKVTKEKQKLLDMHDNLEVSNIAEMATIVAQDIAGDNWDLTNFLANLTETDEGLLILYRLLGLYYAVGTRTQYESLAFITPGGWMQEAPQVADINPLMFSILGTVADIALEGLQGDRYSKDDNSPLGWNKTYLGTAGGKAGDKKWIIHTLKRLPWIKATFTYMDPYGYIDGYLFQRLAKAGKVGKAAFGNDAFYNKALDSQLRKLLPEFETNKEERDRKEKEKERKKELISEYGAEYYYNHLDEFEGNQ